MKYDLKLFLVLVICVQILHLSLILSHTVGHFTKKVHLSFHDI